MRKNRTSGLRMAVAAGGAAVMLAVASCGSDAEENAPDAADGVEEPGQGSTDSATDAGEGDDTAGDGASSGDRADSADVPAPDEDFNPCAVLEPDEVTDIVGFEVSDSKTDNNGPKECLFEAEEGTTFARTAWWPTDRSTDDMLEEAEYDMVPTVDDPEEIAVEGAHEAHVFAGDTNLHQVGATVLAEVENGYFITIVTGGLVSDDPDVDASVEFTELTLSRS